MVITLIERILHKNVIIFHLMHLLEKYANSMWFYVTCTIYAAIYNFMTVIAMLMYCGFYHICISCDLFAKILFKKNS